MAIARTPPRAFTSATVLSSSNEIQSQSKFPLDDWSRSARCPIANFGSVPIPRSCGASSLNLLWCVLRNSLSVVHCCPAWRTYWRSSSQIGQREGGSIVCSNCVPHSTQIKCLIPNVSSDSSQSVKRRGRQAGECALQAALNIGRDDQRAPNLNRIWFGTGRAEQCRDFRRQ
jgi:hypothetical protein